MRRRLTLALLSVLLTAGTLAGTLPPPYAGTPSARDYPGADVLVLREDIALELAADGRVTRRFFRAEKILTYQGMDLVGDPKVPFRTGDQSLSELSLKTYTPEGEVKEAKANSFTEITPFELEKAPDYTAWREMVLTKVGLDVGAVDETRWTLADARPWRGSFDAIVPLADGHPCLARTVTVTVPSETKVLYALWGASGEPEIREASGRTTYAWTFRDQPGFGLSQVARDERPLVPRLLVTTCPDWSTANARCAPLVRQAQAAVSPELAKKADALVKDAATPYQRARAISAWVAEGVRTVEWPLALTGIAPRTASRVFESGYGDALDKAVLLCSLLDRAGIEAAVAVCALAPEGFPDPSRVACVAQFDRVIVHAKVEGKTLWIDPEAPLAERSHRDFLGYKGLPLVPGVAELHTMFAVSEADRLLVELSAKLDAEFAFSGEGTLWLAGAYSPYYGVEDDPEALRAWVGRVLSSVLPGSQVDAHAVAVLAPDQVKVTLQFHGKLAVPAQGHAALAVGRPGDSVLSLLHGMHRGTRDLPLLLPKTGKEGIRLRLALPPGRSPLYLPPAQSVSGAGGALSSAWKVEGTTLVLQSELDLPARVVPAAAYPWFRDLYGRAMAASSSTVLF